MSRRVLLTVCVLWQLAALNAQDPLRQRISFSCADCLPEQALVALSRQTGVNIAFNNYLFENCPPLHLDLQDIPLPKAVEQICDCARINLRFEHGQIILERKIPRYTLSGYVQDAETGEKLIGATVRLGNKPGVGTLSNEFGYFSIRLEEGEHLMQVSYIAHKPLKYKIKLRENQTYTFQLEPDGTLPVVDIRGQPGDGAAGANGEPPRRTLSSENLRALPMPGGEPDLMRQAALQAGVQTGTDGLGGLHVRGGNADQNLILLDDVPVYNPGHALGLFSIFNPSTVSNVRFWKGDQPARYGGRAASVLDIRTRDGNFHDYHINASVGLFAASVVAEGPTVREKGSFLLGMRTTYFEPWIRLLSKRGNLLVASGKNSDYQFYDANIKLNHRLSARDRLFVSYYHGGDNFVNRFSQAYYVDQRRVEERYSINSEWGNAIAALRWNHVFKKNLFSNTTLRFSRFFYQSRQTTNATVFTIKPTVLSNFGQLYQTFIRDWSGKSDFTWYAHEKATLRWGVSYTLHDFRPGAVSVNFNQPGVTEAAFDSLATVYFNNEKLAADESESYLDADLKLFPQWRLETGINASTFQTKSVKIRLLQPKFKLNHNGKHGWSQWVGLHRMGQTLHQIGSFSISLPFELWVPSTPKVLPQLAWQATVGTGQAYKHWGWQAEAYYKRLDRVHTFLSFNDALSNGGTEDASGWQDRIATGTGHSRGIEILLEKYTGSIRGSIAYTLSETNRQFPDLNSGRVFPFRFDRRHDLKINLRQRLGKHSELNLLWVFATGNPITLAAVKYHHESVEDKISREVNVYTEVNGFRLPGYHRLDAGWNLEFKQKYAQHLLQFGVYNAYNRANPFFLYVDANSDVKGKGIQFTLLPVLPVFRYEIKW